MTGKRRAAVDQHQRRRLVLGQVEAILLAQPGAARLRSEGQRRAALGRGREAPRPGAAELDRLLRLSSPRGPGLRRVSADRPRTLFVAPGLRIFVETRRDAGLLEGAQEIVGGPLAGAGAAHARAELDQLADALHGAFFGDQTGERAFELQCLGGVERLSSSGRRDHQPRRGRQTGRRGARTGGACTLRSVH